MAWEAGTHIRTKTWSQTPLMPSEQIKFHPQSQGRGTQRTKTWSQTLLVPHKETASKSGHRTMAAFECSPNPLLILIPTTGLWANVVSNRSKTMFRGEKLSTAPHSAMENKSHTATGSNPYSWLHSPLTTIKCFLKFRLRTHQQRHTSLDRIYPIWLYCLIFVS